MRSYQGVIIIFYRDDVLGRKFLVVENSETGNFSFVGGAQEKDETLSDTAVRETKEELGLDINPVELEKTAVKHEFVYGPQKKERAGAKCVNYVFLVNANNKKIISYTKELRTIYWLTKEEIMNKLSFQDLKTVFLESIK